MLRTLLLCVGVSVAIPTLAQMMNDRNWWWNGPLPSENYIQQALAEYNAGQLPGVDLSKVDVTTTGIDYQPMAQAGEFGYTRIPDGWALSIGIDGQPYIVRERSTGSNEKGRQWFNARTGAPASEIYGVRSQDTGEFLGGGRDLLTIGAMMATPWLAGGGAAAGAEAAYGGFDSAAVAGANYAGADPIILANAGTTMTDVGGGYGLSDLQAGLDFQDRDLVSGMDVSKIAPQGINVPGYGTVYGGQYATGALKDALMATQAGKALFTNPDGTPKAPATPGQGSNVDALKRILSGNGTLDDILKIGGAAAPGVLGAIASNKQADAIKELGDKYFSIGEPSRQRYEASFKPGFSMETADPAMMGALETGTRGVLNRLSVGTGTGGIAMQPGALEQSIKDVNAQFTMPWLTNWRNQNAATGGFGAFNTAVPSIERSATDANANTLNSLGYAAGNIFNPPKNRSLADIIKEAGLYG